MFLLVPTGNPPSLRFGHPDVTTEDTTPPPRRKNTRPRFSKGRAWVRDTGITNWRGRDCRLLNLLLAPPGLICKGVHLTHFLRTVAGNPPSLRFGHPEGASGRCKSARQPFQ